MDFHALIFFGKCVSCQLIRNIIKLVHSNGQIVLSLFSKCEKSPKNKQKGLHIKIFVVLTHYQVDRNLLF